MKRITTIALGLGLVTFLDATSEAADHFARVGEVMISNQGSNASQFIELEDPFGESFPSPPYTMNIFDAGGASLGTVALTIPSGTTRLLVATPTAATQFGVTAQATLSITLPTNGQACFQRDQFR